MKAHIRDNSIGADDVAVMNIALDSFIAIGNNIISNKEMVPVNKKIAIECKGKLKNKQMQFSLDETRVIYVSLSLFKEDLTSDTIPLDDDKELNQEFNKYSHILDKLLSMFGDTLPDV